jgi:ankyrin repeat protein
VTPAAELSRAIRAGDPAGVRGVLDSHPELKATLDQPMQDGDFGGTPLLAAVATGKRELVATLLEAGADINQKSHWWAGGFGVLDGDTPLLDWLIERGATVDAYAAARHGMIERLRTLVATDPAAVRQRGGDGQTPLHVAKTVEVAAWLLDHGAELDALDVDHESTPAMYQVADRPEVARYLVGRGCRTDLLMASALGELALVERHLEADPASVRIAVTNEHFPMRDARAGGTIYIWQLGHGATPHLVAHRFGHSEVLERLIAASPPPLQLAVALELGDEALAERLLAAAPGLIDQLGEADLQRLPAAAFDGNLAAVRRMLRAGWPVDAPGREGGSALHWAAFQGDAGMVREILPYGPDLSRRDRSFNGRPIDWARYGAGQWGDREGRDYPAIIALLDS